jgi:DNA-binding winged helix-turn-helix (wHTH) protein/Tfp pilus assembly protein PilF
VDYGQGKFLLGEWQIDPQHNVIIKTSDSDKIEKRLIRVLVMLANNSNQVVPKDQLLKEVWQGKIVSDETISVAISKLRKALGCNAKNPSYIETVTGVGFRLIVEPKANEPLLEAIDTGNSADNNLTYNTKKISPWYKSPFSYALLATFISLIAVYQMFSTHVSDGDAAKEIINNESYAKALYLMQQDSDGLYQADVLLTKLNQQQPDNPLILNALGKVKYFQYWDVDKQQRTLLINDAIALFEQAIAIDNELGDAYLQLALINMVLKRNFTLAEEYFIQSITLNPEQLIAHIQYASLLLSQRRFDKAIFHNKIAQTIDPEHYSSASIEWIYNMAEQYEAAEKELAKLFTIDPDSEIYNTSAIRLYESVGNENRAYLHYQKAFKLAGYSDKELTEVNNAFKLGGLKQVNYWLVNIKQEQADIGQYIPPISTARYHVASGEYEQALSYLELAHIQDDSLTLWFNSDPKYKPLRNYPRFKELIKNINKTIN